MNRVRNGEFSQKRHDLRLEVHEGHVGLLAMIIRSSLSAVVVAVVCFRAG
jgi:hypothetical protein